MRLIALFLAALISDTAGADDSAGKVLHDKSCVACHARMYGGDGSKMYTRDGRLVTNKQELAQRVAACSAMAKAGWTSQEEAAVAAWLNQQYYQFDK